jgi:hypothetical protein
MLFPEAKHTGRGNNFSGKPVRFIRFFPREPPSTSNLDDRASSSQPPQPVGGRRSCVPCRCGDRAQGRPGTRTKGFDERQLPARDANRIDDAGRSARGRLMV